MIIDYWPKLVAGVLLLLALLATGCKITGLEEGASSAVYIDHPDYPETKLRLNNVALLDDSIARKIEVQRSGSRRTATDTLQVFAVYRNRTDYSLQIESRVWFMDTDKNTVEGPTAWKRIMLDPNAIVNWKELSTERDISYYYIEVREGR
jgi:hypothetical protein